MPVEWKRNEREAVEAVLLAHPAASGRCFDAARAVLTIARGRDPAARGWKIRPRKGRFVVPKQDLGQRWFHHYTVEVDHHGVDALTGPDGTPWDAYLPTHWLHSTYLSCAETDLEDEDR
jgi:hypothetical protein